MNDFYSTERLILRRLTNEDTDAIFAMRSDAEFMRHLTRCETREEARAWIEFVSSFWKYNAGFWAVVYKESGATIGWCGTWTLLEFEPGVVEIGYAIAKEFEGRGLATEAAKFALNYAFEIRRAVAVNAVATAENYGSQRIMQKLGMRFGGKQFFPAYNKEMVYYSVSRADYEQSARGSLQNI